MENETNQNKQNIIKNINTNNFINDESIFDKSNKNEIKQSFNYRKSKWANLKYLLQDLESLKSSIKLLKTQTIGQFFSKCHNIYKSKIEIYLLAQKNKKLLINLNHDPKDIMQKINVKDDLSDLPSEFIKDFMFLFREDNNLMYKIIESSDRSQDEVLAPFLCHLFYENFFVENSEQEEMLYIIYLLLEKEIDALLVPSLLSFLNNSFLSKFLNEFRNRYEIITYINIILNNLIRNINELNLSFYSLNIISSSKNQIKKANIKNPQKIIKCIFMDLKLVPDNYRKSETLPEEFTNHNNPNIEFKRSNTNDNLGKINNDDIFGDNIRIENKIFKNIINKNFFNNIDENFIKKSFEKEKNEIMKQYYLKKLKIICSVKKRNLYNTNDYYNILKEEKFITLKSVEKYNKGVELILNFIDELLTNMQNISVIPYSVKVICKIIFILIKKKFKCISLMQCNLFLCRFLFDIIILPALQNPDMNIIYKDEIITLNTRKNLSNIYTVLRTFIRGDLFTSIEDGYMTVFNKFFIDNYLRLNNILLKIINVQLPEKLEKLSLEFYSDDNFLLNNDLRYFRDINYDYFMENNNDFMQYKSICFNTEHFFIFYEIIIKNPEKFFRKGSEEEKIFNNISRFIGMIKKNRYVYYVIVNNKYNNEIEELLFPKKNKIMLGMKKNKNDLLKNLKYSITYLLNNLKIISLREWVDNTKFKTIDILSFVNKYLNDSEKYMGILSNGPPLSWYSSYILKNISLIENEYSDNDYHKLYEEILNDTLKKIDKLKEINNFLTVNIITKFNLINDRMKIFEKELETIKNIEITLQATRFMETTQIPICLIDEKEYNKIKKIIPKEKYLPKWSSISKQNKILTWQKNCLHKFLEKALYKTLENNGYLSKFHFNTIKKFSKKFKTFHKQIINEITNRSFGLEFRSMGYNLALDNNINIGEESSGDNNKKQLIPKNILEEYLTFVSSQLNDDKSLYIDPNEKVESFEYYENGFEIIAYNSPKSPNNNENENDDLEKEKDEKKLKPIRNYILKVLNTDIYEDQPLIVDESFFVKCISFSWVLPKNLEIANELCYEKLFDEIRYRIKNMDKLRTPDNIIEEFGIAVNLINSMYIFLMNNKEVEAGELLPIIIYCIISSRPHRIISNINFIKYFLNGKDLFSNIGYNVTQLECSINFIQRLGAKQLNISQEEFNEKCKSIKIK